jgi:hypothetical protein
MDGYIKVLGNQTEFSYKIVNVIGKNLINKIIPPNSTILDYGCGNYTIPKQTKDLSIEGYDIDTENEKADYHDLAEIKNNYDYIIAHHVVEHMTPEEAKTFFSWAQKRCKTLIIGEPNGSNMWVPFYMDFTHVRPYYALITARLLCSMGYEIQDIYYCNIEPGIRRRIFDAVFSVNPYQEFIIVANTKKV